MKIEEFLRASEQRGAMSLRDHLNSTPICDLPDQQAVSKMRRRVINALKSKKNEPYNQFILADNETPSKVVAPVRPQALDVAHRFETIRAKSYQLPSTMDKLTAAETATARIRSNDDRKAVGEAIGGLSDEIVLREAREKAQAERAADLAKQVESEREHNRFLQQLILKNGGGGSDVSR